MTKIDFRDRYAKMDSLTLDELADYHAHLLTQVLDRANIKYGELSMVLESNGTYSPTVTNEFGIQMSIVIRSVEYRSVTRCLSIDGDDNYAFILLNIDGYWYSVAVKIDDGLLPHILYVIDTPLFTAFARGEYTVHGQRMSKVQSLLGEMSEDERVAYSGRLLTQLIDLYGLTAVSVPSKSENHPYPTKYGETYLSVVDNTGASWYVRRFNMPLYFNSRNCTYIFTCSRGGMFSSIGVELDDETLPNIVRDTHPEWSEYFFRLSAKVEGDDEHV